MDNKPIWSPRSRAGLEPHASIKVIWVTRVANKLLERLKLGEPVAGCIGHPQNGEVIRSQDFEMGCELVKKVHNHNDKVDMSGKLEAYFVDTCEKISSSELTSLLHFLLELNKNEERWSYQAKELFYLLEREMCRRLYSCFQEKLHKNEDFLKFAEKNIHLMLEYEVGYKLFMAYTRYCMFDFSSAVSLENLPLLLLSTIRVLDRSYVLFSLLEDFVLRNYDHLDINTLSFFCVSSLICSHPITSCQLLDQLGTTLMCQLQSSLNDNVVNILKGVQFSGYNKVSFYCDFELCMERNYTISKCQINQLIHIIKAFKEVGKCSDNLLRDSAERCKSLVKQEYSYKFRTKDFGILAHTLGYFQYRDTSDNDIYTLCADQIVERMDNTNEPSKNDLMYMTSCAAGLLYAGKFHHRLFDVLFGIPGLETSLLDVRRSELLLIDGTLRLQHPEYTGRLLESHSLTGLKRAIRKEWSLDRELSRRPELKMAIDTLKLLVGENNVRLDYVLSHIKSADIILCLDRENKVVKPDLSRTRRVAIQVVGLKHYIKDTGMLLGRYALKQRQLKYLGFQIITVYPHEERSVLTFGTEAEQKEFWINKLKSNGIVLP